MPFALWPAFPTAPVGRDAHDDYGTSVTLGLAPRRPSRIPARATSERAVGAPFVSLSEIFSHRPTGRKVPATDTLSPCAGGSARRALWSEDVLLHRWKLGFE